MNESDREPLVSICCLTYNHEPYIRDAIEGFLMQKTDFPFEILIHDDASTDGTADIIREYETKYPDIIKPIYQTENQYSKGIKISATYNYPRAKGKYIALCEGDDYWIDPYKLQKQVDFLEKNEEYGICFTYSNKINEKGKLIELINSTAEIEYHQYDFLIGRKYQTRTATIVLNREILRNEKYINTKIYNGDTWIKILATENKKGIVLPFISAVYRIHSGGIWSRADTFSKCERSYNDWKIKLKYAFYKNIKAVPIIFGKTIHSLFKLQILKIYKLFS